MIDMLNYNPFEDDETVVPDSEIEVLRVLLKRGRLRAVEFIEFGGVSRREALEMWAIKVDEILSKKE